MGKGKGQIIYSIESTFDSFTSYSNVCSSSSISNATKTRKKYLNAFIKLLIQMALELVLLWQRQLSKKIMEKFLFQILILEQNLK